MFYGEVHHVKHQRKESFQFGECCIGTARLHTQPVLRKRGKMGSKIEKNASHLNSCSLIVEVYSPLLLQRETSNEGETYGHCRE